MTPTKHLNILVVDDSDADAELIREGLNQANIASDIHVVEHGGKAISFLHKEGQYTRSPRPDLVLVDLNMPAINGHRVLQHVQSDPELRDIPIVVLTSENDANTVNQSYKRQALAHLIKPKYLDELADLATDIGNFL